MRRIIDISATLKAGIKSDPPGMEPQIEYHDHHMTAPRMADYMGVPIASLPEGEYAAVERVNISTHNGTHMDAPYHYFSRQDERLVPGGRPSLRIERHPGSPPLGRQTGKIAMIAKRLDPGLEPGGKVGDVVGRLLQLPRVAAGEDDRPRGGALGVGRVGARKEQTGAGDAIEGRRADPRCAVGPGVAIAPVIGNGKKDVWPPGLPAP